MNKCEISDQKKNSTFAKETPLRQMSSAKNYLEWMIEHILNP